MLYISGSNHIGNSYKIAKDTMKETDELITLANKNMKFCLGCNECEKDLNKLCVLDDYITNTIYPKIMDNNEICIISPLYMSQMPGILKNLIDRLVPFYRHNIFNKKIYLILHGNGTEEENEDEINNIKEYFSGVGEWMKFDFVFLDYFCTEDNQDYKEKIDKIKSILFN